MTRSRQLALTLLATVTASALGACATIAPEDYARKIVFDWDLTPEAVPVGTQTVQHGDIVVAWTAEAKATHETTIDGKAVPLTLGRTTRGTVYCASEADGDRCYEDRDSDQRLDHIWTPTRSDEALKAFQVVGRADAMETTLPLRATASDTTVLKNDLGLLYDGPMRGMVGEDGIYDAMIGWLELGFFNGRGAGWLPNGKGWMPVNLLPVIVLRDMGESSEIAIDALGFSYGVGEADVTGSLEIDFDAQPVEGADVTAKPEIDVDKLPDFDESGDPVET